jgi:nicotinamidase/pyrazinamidase
MLHPGVDRTVADLILRKGTRREVDSYSAFRENHGPAGTRLPTGLAGWLHERGNREVHVCGLARDYCALCSAQDAVRSGFRMKFLWELTRPVTRDNDGMDREALAKATIAVI